MKDKKDAGEIKAVFATRDTGDQINKEQVGIINNQTLDYLLLPPEMAAGCTTPLPNQGHGYTTLFIQ